MKIASHNSWSYLPARKWWMRLFSFTAKCQDVDIRTQYIKYNVRCFDLRLKFSESGAPIVVHNLLEYKLSEKELLRDLEWLNLDKDVAIRVLLDARFKNNFTTEQVDYFKSYCALLEKTFPNIMFWCGRNLYNWEILYPFAATPSCEEKYSSVCKPKILDDWYPRLYAKKNNKEILQKGSDADYLMIDFVNYN